MFVEYEKAKMQEVASVTASPLKEIDGMEPGVTTRTPRVKVCKVSSVNYICQCTFTLESVYGFINFQCEESWQNEDDVHR